MIMPVSAVSCKTKPSFYGAIKVAAPIDEAVSKFTVMETRRWNEINSLAEHNNDNLLFQIGQNIKQIGKTIIKSIIISSNKDGILAEDVYNVTKGGTVLLFSREAISRTILETLENIYKK